VHGPCSGFVRSSTKVLACVSRVEDDGGRKNVQNGITDEKHEKTEREKSQTSQVDYTSPREDVAVSLVLLVWIGIVQVVVLLHVFREKQQSSRRVNVELLRYGLGVQIFFAASSRRRSRIIERRSKRPSRHV
jgi:hypothetical protein